MLEIQLLSCFGAATGHKNRNGKINNVIIDQEINTSLIYGL